MASEKTATLPGEHVIKASDQATLLLTNYRVILDEAATGSSRHISITLDSVASCGLVTNSRPSLLIGAGIAGLIAFAQSDSAIRYLLLFVAVVLVIVYFVTRSAVINVSSSGGERILVPASGMDRDQIIPFIEAIMRAKIELLGRLASAAPSTERAVAVAKEESDAKGLCPNCDAVIPLASPACPKCKADFSAGSSWKIASL